MTVSKRTRYEVLRRDNHTCRYCGGTAPDVLLTIDHVTPTALGGSDLPENLVAACKDCNAGKTSSTPDAALVANVSDDAIRWARALAKAAEITDTQAQETKALLEWFHGIWVTETIWNVPLPPDWRDSIVNFVAAGLTPTAIEDAVRITVRRPGVDETRMFKYFCGVCWVKVRELRQMASEMLAVEAPNDE